LPEAALPGVVLAHEVDWEGFRAAARALALGGIPPDSVVWSVRAIDDLFGSDAPSVTGEGAFRLPRALVSLAETVIQASDPQRFALLYRLVWRAFHGERHLLEQITDPQVDRANRLAQAVRRDTHKMRAFVRFRVVNDGGEARHVAWFEPLHFIVEANATFFVRRFAGMTWSILTPYRTVHWDGAELAFTPGARLADVPDDDRLAEYWRVYFSAIFNPARLKIDAMTSEMPRKYWKNLPEAAAIPELIEGAARRTEAMEQQTGLAPPRPVTRRARPPGPLPNSNLARARIEAAQCHRCALWQPATQMVFGEGPADARIMLVGEQPGDHEDLAGRSFVGPAGQLLDRALGEARLDRASLYVTNAVKHFKFRPRGKRRIHERPDAGEIQACRFWLDIERDHVAPSVTIMLGATAGQAVLGRAVAVQRDRGVPLPLASGWGVLTVHPAFLLRLPDQEARAREYAAFLRDLVAARVLAEAAGRTISPTQ
jgi:DNA polymerase